MHTLFPRAAKAFRPFTNTEFGVLYPRGRVVAVFDDEVAAAAACRALAPMTGRRYRPAHVRQAADRSADNASVLAAFGFGWQLLFQYRRLARKGKHFVVIDADRREQTAVTAALTAHDCRGAWRYGWWTIEEWVALLD